LNEKGSRAALINSGARKMGHPKEKAPRSLTEGEKGVNLTSPTERNQ